jgi:cyclic pyranopterin phosphate synthase
MAEFSHLDAGGRAQMVDVGHKPVQARMALAVGILHCAPETVAALRDQTVPKGDVLTVAKIAAIQAAKRTDELVPLCHSLPLDGVDVRFTLREGGVFIEAEARTQARTGVEMEALTAVCVAALTIYDMCKAIDKGMIIGDVRLANKTKG